MKTVTLLAVVDPELCAGEGICERVCPVYAASLRPRPEDPKRKLAVIDPKLCQGCRTCEQRCPELAITMQPLPEPRLVRVEFEGLRRDEVDGLCRKAKLNPEQILCYCTETRAQEVAAAIMKGARSPVDLSRMTGIRMGCSIECIQPQMRLLEAAGIKWEEARGWQYYGDILTVWDLAPSLRKGYQGKGFHFDEDERLLDRIVEAQPQGR